MLIGLAVWVVARSAGGAGGESVSDAGLSATLLYLALYVAASIGTFAALVFLGREGNPIDNIDDLSGIGGRHRIAALALAVFMFSLAGIPPLAGFWGKFSLFASALAVPDSATMAWRITTSLVCVAGGYRGDQCGGFCRLLSARGGHDVLSQS